jgi:hypothetical protein
MWDVKKLDNLMVQVYILSMCAMGMILPENGLGVL